MRRVDHGSLTLTLNPKVNPNPNPHPNPKGRRPTTAAPETKETPSATSLPSSHSLEVRTWLGLGLGVG